MGGKEIKERKQALRNRKGENIQEIYNFICKD